MCVEKNERNFNPIINKRSWSVVGNKTLCSNRMVKCFIEVVRLPQYIKSSHLLQYTVTSIVVGQFDYNYLRIMQIKFTNR